MNIQMKVIGIWQYSNGVLLIMLYKVVRIVSSVDAIPAKLLNSTFLSVVWFVML